jgi:hypothetical protein
LKNAGSVIYYECPPNGHKVIIGEKSISSFDLTLTFADEDEVVDLNGLDAEYSLIFQIIRDKGRAEAAQDIRELMKEIIAV